MKRMIIIGTTLFTALLFAGSIYFPNQPLMWFAATTWQYEVIRAVLILLLGVILFSHPPRALYFRLLIAAIAVALIGVSISSVLNYSMNILDGIVFIEVAIIFGIEALEAETYQIALPKVLPKTKTARS